MQHAERARLLDELEEAARHCPVCGRDADACRCAARERRARCAEYYAGR